MYANEISFRIIRGNSIQVLWISEDTVIMVFILDDERIIKLSIIIDAKIVKIIFFLF